MSSKYSVHSQAGIYILFGRYIAYLRHTECEVYMADILGLLELVN